MDKIYLAKKKEWQNYTSEFINIKKVIDNQIQQTIPTYEASSSSSSSSSRRKNDERGVGSKEGEGSRSWRMPQVCPASYPIGLQLDNVLLLVGRFSVTTSTSEKLRYGSPRPTAKWVHIPATLEGLGRDRTRHLETN